MSNSKKKWKKKKLANKTDIAVLITMILLMLIGLVLIICGAKDVISEVLKTWGIVLLILSIPLLVKIIYQVMKDKIDKI